MLMVHPPAGENCRPEEVVGAEHGQRRIAEATMRATSKEVLDAVLACNKGGRKGVILKRSSSTCW